LGLSEAACKLLVVILLGLVIVGPIVRVITDMGKYEVVAGVRKGIVVMVLELGDVVVSLWSVRLW
jgi:hypothetical protein